MSGKNKNSSGNKKSESSKFSNKKYESFVKARVGTGNTNQRLPKQINPSAYAEK